MNEKLTLPAYITSGIGLILFTLGACTLDSTGIYWNIAVVLMILGGALFLIGERIQERYEARTHKKR